MATILSIPLYRILWKWPKTLIETEKCSKHPMSLRLVCVHSSKLKLMIENWRFMRCSTFNFTNHILFAPKKTCIKLQHSGVNAMGIRRYNIVDSNKNMADKMLMNPFTLDICCCCKLFSVWNIHSQSENRKIPCSAHHANKKTCLLDSMVNWDPIVETVHGHV